MDQGTHSVNVRLIDRDNLDYLLRWRMESMDTVFEDQRPYDDRALRAANQDFYEKNLGTSHFACIASLDGHDVGCGALCLQEELPSPDNPSGRSAYVMNIYTRPSARGNGVASAMVRSLIGIARSHGADKIYLEATEDGEPLYDGLGFEAMEGMMKLVPAEG